MNDFFEPLHSGFEIKVMENPNLPKGQAVLFLHPDDYKIVDEYYKKQENESNRKHESNLEEHRG